MTGIASIAPSPALLLRPATRPAPELASPASTDAKQVADAYMSGRQTARDIVKAHARERAEQLREQMRILTRLLGADPKALAKQVARIAKELRAVLKDFNDAHKGDVEDAALKRQQATAETQSQASAAPVAPATPEELLQARRRAAGLEETPEALEAKQFIAELRGFLKKLKEILEAAKVKGGATKEGDDDPFKQARDELSELERALDRAFRDVDSEPNVTDAPGSLVSMTA